MRTVLAELYRTASAAREGILQEDARYMLALADDDVRMVEPRLSFKSYRQLLRNLDYDSSTAEQRRKAIVALGVVATRVLCSDLFDWRAANGDDDAEAIQLDLVLNPAELSGVPFEVALAADERCLFEGRPPVIVTRRIRGAFNERRKDWPHDPRILFAWASPPAAGKAAPVQAHLDALLEALKPWIEPLAGVPGAGDYRRVLTIVENATLSGIRDACTAAVARKQPFTHVHLLAHGHTIADDDFVSRRFGIALHADDDAAGMSTASPEELVTALEPVAGSCVVVTTAVCYGGSQANPMIPEGGIAHTLHSSGLPIVLASQWPLTFQGSEEITRRFYGPLLRGQDARLALHATRTALRARSDECLEDWASLVCYMSLPEGYADYLHGVALKAALAALETASRWADALVLTEKPNVKTFERVAAQFQERAADLEELLARGQSKERGGVLGENLGLLGSAHKRIAELYHRWNRISGGDADRRAAMLDEVREARKWYGEGAERDLGDHWLATQWLSLEAVLTGRIADPLRWQIALRAAQLATRGTEPYWGWGSVAELHLLAPAAGQPLQVDAARDALRQLVSCTPDLGPIRVTRRQLERYRAWWTAENGFFAVTEDLSRQATELVAVLEEAVAARPEIG